MSQQPKPVRILIRKLLRTEDNILRFCKANRATILECGQYLYVFEKSDFSETTLRWFYNNDNLSAAYDVFGCLKLNSGQIKELLDDWIPESNPTPPD